MGHSDCINKCSRECCEWYIVSEKQPKSALANYVRNVGKSPSPSLPKLSFLSVFLRKAFEFRFPV